jgi:hypothetical protein
LLRARREAFRLISRTYSGPHMAHFLKPPRIDLTGYDDLTEVQ